MRNVGVKQQSLDAKALSWGSNTMSSWHWICSIAVRMCERPMSQTETSLNDSRGSRPSEIDHHGTE
jgi:hypothetical protein